jgi:hypothetical protein
MNAVNAPGASGCPSSMSRTTRRRHGQSRASRLLGTSSSAQTVLPTVRLSRPHRFARVRTMEQAPAELVVRVGGAGFREACTSRVRHGDAQGARREGRLHPEQPVRQAAVQQGVRTQGNADWEDPDEIEPFVEAKIARTPSRCAPSRGEDGLLRCSRRCQCWLVSSALGLVVTEAGLSAPGSTAHDRVPWRWLGGCCGRADSGVGSAGGRGGVASGALRGGVCGT